MTEDDPDITGSYMDGCNIDLPRWCGLELTDEEHNALWGHINTRDLLEAAGAYLEIEEGPDDTPGMSDTYYTVSYDDEFKGKLKENILNIINNNI